MRRVEAPTLCAFALSDLEPSSRRRLLSFLAASLLRSYSIAVTSVAVDCFRESTKD